MITDGIMMNAIQNLNSTNNVNGSLAIEVYLKNFRKGFLLNLSPIPKHVSYAITYTGTPLIQSPMGQIKFALLTGWPYQRGFFSLTRKCMAVFDRRPKKSGRDNEVAVRRGFTVL